MKIAAITGIRQAEITERPDPKAQASWAVVKIHSAPMCTEFKMFTDGEKSSCIGHEASGEIIECGAGASVKKGDRVVVQPLYACGQCKMCFSGNFILCEHQL